MIHQQSSYAQFVTTTFRAELLKDADRHFGVFYRGKASQVDLYERRIEGMGLGWTWCLMQLNQVMVVEREEAKDFVEHD